MAFRPEPYIGNASETLAQKGKAPAPVPGPSYLVGKAASDQSPAVKHRLCFMLKCRMSLGPRFIRFMHVLLDSQVR